MSRKKAASTRKLTAMVSVARETENVAVKEEKKTVKKTSSPLATSQRRRVGESGMRSSIPNRPPGPTSDCSSADASCCPKE